MPSLESPEKIKPANYMRFVTKGMQKAELIPKVIMTPHDDPRLFVEDFSLKVCRADVRYSCKRRRCLTRTRARCATSST